MVSPSPRPADPEEPGRLYLWLGLALAGLLLAARTVRFSMGMGGDLVDFDCFHIVARLIAEGRAGDAYRFATLGPALAAEKGGAFMPFTYPPPFELLLAPLGRMPRGLAYVLFEGLALAAFLLVLRRVAGREGLAGAVLVCLPAMIVNLACGQNGLLTGALSGAAALGLAARRGASGAPLGLMIIKPHLAVALSVQAAAGRRWLAMAVAAAIILASAGLATLAFGAGVWIAFLDGVREATAYLQAGLYPLNRMASIYAALRPLGVPPVVCMAAQALAGAMALALVAWAAVKAPPRRAAGLALLAGPLVSPYVYDYDLAAFALGLVVLGPELRRAGRPGELAAIYALAGVAALAGYAVALVRGGGAPPIVLPSAFALWLSAGLAWRILRRREGVEIPGLPTAASAA